MSALAIANCTDERFVPLAREAIGDVAPVTIIVPPGPENLWPAILAAGQKGQFIAARDVAASLNCAPTTVEAYLAKLRAAGLVARVGEATDTQSLWALTTRRRLAPFVDGRGSPSHSFEMANRMWRALKMGKELSVTMLRSFVDDDDFQLSSETARLYLNALSRAGYLHTIPAANPCGEQRYRIVPTMMTGPLPPRLLRATIVYDPNRKAIAGASAAADEVRL